MIKKFNWQIWLGFLLAFAGAVTYSFVFVDYPALRDFPWTALGFFALALGFLFAGFGRAFAVGSRLRSKIAASIVGLLTLAVMGLFLFAVLIAARWLPESKNAPHVGQAAPEFTLPDINGKPVSLSELRSTPIGGNAPKGVLLIFYRGYW
ncbi:MAG TPA: hypothetical protein VIG25_23855 [Pyrinomonadaceae bacterium]|jgi:hypothetical protein